MNSDLIEEWEKIIGPDRIKIISNKYFDSRLDLEFPTFRRGTMNIKNLSVRSELENNANILNEFEKNGFLTHDEVSRMIEVSTRNIISKKIPDPLLNSVFELIDDEILKNIRIRLLEIERKGFITLDEVSRIVKVLDRNLKDRILSRPLFRYVCFLMEDKKNKDHEDYEWLENLTGYIRWGLEEEEKIMEELKNKNEVLD